MKSVKMFDVGRVCTKLAGRDAGSKCVIVDIIDSQHVLIDGATRRRKCNVSHLVPEDTTLDIAKGASHEDVASSFEKELGIKALMTTKKEAKERPRKKRVTEMLSKESKTKSAAKTN